MAVVLVYLLILGLLSRGFAASVSTDSFSRAYATEQRDLDFTELDIIESTQPSTCPTWFHHENSEDDSGPCICGRSLRRVIRCDPSTNQTSILNCNCMTTHGDISGRPQTVVGACIYNCFNTSSYSRKDAVYHDLPGNISLLNSQMCDHLQRTGKLCGDCKNGYYLAPYTYHLQCFKCTYSPSNWLWYVAVAYGPLTVFFIIMVSCRISILSGQLTAFVHFSQAITAPINLRVVLAALESKSTPAGTAWFVKVLAALFGIWNLDFFRTLVPPICLNVTTLQAAALEYGIATYPLALIGTTYALIELHERNFRLVVWIWKPLHRCFSRVRNRWDMKTSIIDAFATFLFLSYMKIVSVSSDILLYTNLYDVEGRPTAKRLYYNASVEYFGTEHLPYAITAVTVLITFVLLPLILLLLYPLRTFQKCLGYYRLRTHMLTTFVDSIQGCYKDGTNGTRDCRYFCITYVIVRLTCYGLYAFTLDVYFYSLAALFVALLGVLYFVFQPYKKSAYNYVDVILSLNFAGWCVSVTSLSIASARSPAFVRFSFLLATIFTTGPLIAITAVLLYWIIAKKRLPQRLLLRTKKWLQNSDFRSHESFEHAFPHRLLFPGEYNHVAPFAPQEDPEDKEGSVEDPEDKEGSVESECVSEESLSVQDSLSEEDCDS